MIPRIWPGETVYIVGGGPSLIGFDWERLRGKHVIAVNRSYEKLPAAQYVYFSDCRFWRTHKDALLRYAGTKVTMCKMHAVERYGVVTVRQSGVSGLDPKPTNLRSGNNSGYAAINMAVHLGAAKIVGLGFDMVIAEPDAPQQHWHNGHPTYTKQKNFEKMVGYFETLVEPLAEAGVEFVIANPASAITCFPRVSLDSVFGGDEAD